MTTTLAKDGTRDRLVSAAADLVHAESYHSVGVKAICERAGVRRGSFYHFFESKQALMLEALERIWDGFDREVLAVCTDAQRTPRERMHLLIDRLYGRHVRDQQRTGTVLGCSFGNLSGETASCDEAIRHRLVRVFEDWATALEAPLAEALATGEIDGPVPTRTVAMAILSELQGLILIAKLNNDPEVIRTGGHHMIDRVWGTPARTASRRNP